MEVTASQRLEMHLELRKKLGDTVANTLMEHLPPSGWSDVARVPDVQRLEKGLGRLDAKLNIVIGSVLTATTAVIIMLIQLNQSISAL